MKILFMTLCLCLISNITLADNTTKRPFNWVSERTINSKTIIRSSISDITDIELDEIKYKIIEIKRLFFTFEHLGKCNLGLLDIRMLSIAEINDWSYFYKVAGDYNADADQLEYYGRYFRNYGILYITHVGLKYKPRQFAHEMSHYFFDSCGEIFISEDAEHRRIKKFERFYMKETEW